MTADELGKIGEKNTFDMLTKKFPDSLFLHDIYVETNSGNLTQIDLVMLCPFCLIVFEIKNYSGYLLGTADEKYWYHNYGGKIYRIYSPVFQNNGHVNAIKNLFPDFPDYRIVSCIVFCGSCPIPVNIPSLCRVALLDDFIQGALVRCASFGPPVPSDVIRKMASVLTARSSVSDETVRRHLEFVTGLK